MTLLHAQKISIDENDNVTLQQNVISNVGSEITYLVEQNDTSLYEDNLLKVEIHFEEFNYQQIEERQKYKVS